MDVSRAVQEGHAFVKNAEEELDRKILREDQLYFIDNQVEAIDSFLADTEDLQSQSEELRALRLRLRELKTKLERKSMEFLASTEGGDLPEELPPEEMAREFVEFGKEFLDMARVALSKKDVTVETLRQEWEDPLLSIKSYLADSEPYASTNPNLASIRESLKSSVRELEGRISTLLEEWRKSDLSSDEEEEE